jgi:hypothetical protein
MMTKTITLPHASTEERSRLLSMDLIRGRALDRLYERRDAVQNLICALEDYQKSREARLAQCISFSSLPKYSSDFVQSRI